MGEALILTIYNHLSQILERVKDNFWMIKLPLSIAYAFMWSISAYLFGTENNDSLIAILILIVIDLITALIAEYKSGNPIESRKILKTATKFVIYCLMISGAYLTEKIIPGNTCIDMAAIAFLAITEMISILENIGRAGYAIPQKLLNQLNKLKDK